MAACSHGISHAGQRNLETCPAQACHPCSCPALSLGARGPGLAAMGLCVSDADLSWPWICVLDRVPGWRSACPGSWSKGLPQEEATRQRAGVVLLGVVSSVMPHKIRNMTRPPACCHNHLAKVLRTLAALCCGLQGQGTQPGGSAAEGPPWHTPGLGPGTWESSPSALPSAGERLIKAKMPASLPSGCPVQEQRTTHMNIRIYCNQQLFTARSGAVIHLKK